MLTLLKNQRPQVRALIKVSIAMLIVAGLLWVPYLQVGGWMMINPKYRQARLLGLTSAQVVHRLGPPNFDPRVQGDPPMWTSEAADGPLVLGYYYGGATCRIEFKNDRVVSVERYWK